MYFRWFWDGNYLKTNNCSLFIRIQFWNVFPPNFRLKMVRFGWMVGLKLSWTRVIFWSWFQDPLIQQSAKPTHTEGLWKCAGGLAQLVEKLRHICFGVYFWILQTSKKVYKTIPSYYNITAIKNLRHQHILINFSYTIPNN